MKINLRSPYIVSANDANLEFLKLELFVYTGVKNTDRTPAIYTLTTDNEFVFEIAELAREYLDVLFSGAYLEQNIWVDYRLTKTINGVETVGSYVNLEGFYGYGYFEDGINPQTSTDLLQDNLNVYKPENSCHYIPIKTDGLINIEHYYLDGTSENITYSFDQNNSSDLMYYLINCSGDIEKLFQDGISFLFQDGIQFLFVEGSDSTQVVKYVLNYTGKSPITVNIITVPECTYTPQKVTFVNKYGALQDIWFFKNTTLSLTTKEDSYKNNILNFDTYSTTEHENQTLTKQGNEKLTLNSGYYPENFNEVFKQLLLSEKVWLTDNNKALPVNVSDSNLTFKNRLYDKLINYTINFDYAFDTINKIR